MQITINVPDEHINGALAEPHSRYWAREAGWDPETSAGFVYEPQDNGADARHVLNAAKLEKALWGMAEKYPRQFARLISGDYDGSTGDVLLQLMAFGELRYG